MLRWAQHERRVPPAPNDDENMSRQRARDLLGEGGLFVRSVEGYQVRDGQLQVTDSVERLLARDGVLLCEAGTGIGKTFAYLVPALLSGRKIVISTATKTLQDQIAARDLPMVQRVLSTDVPVRTMKGLGNYLCRRRLHEFSLSEEALRPMYAEPLRLLRSWLKNTEMGDFSELVTLSETDRVRHAVGSSSDTRLGAKCPYFDECFVTEMKRDAEQAQIIVVNHHLFFADLALRGPHPGRVLPDYDAVIFDEAHQIEDIAALFFGIRVTEAQAERLLKECGRLLSRASALGGPLDAHAGLNLVEFALGLLHQLFQVLCPMPAGRRMLAADAFSAETGKIKAALEQSLLDLKSSLDSRAATIRDDLALSEGLAQSGRRLEALRESLVQFTVPTEGRVNWVERVDGRAVISSTPVDLSSTLRNKLFESVPAVCLMSATLATGTKSEAQFKYVRSRLGLYAHPQVEELKVPSPFSFEEQCVLYIPRDLPEVASGEFLDRAADRINELIEMTDGGAFVLTTSLSSMKELHQRLKMRLSARLLLLQGERPKGALLSAFRADGSAVLVATSSFWEGVDVPGRALRLVVLEKLPFAVPTDPVFQARSRALEEAGKSPFTHLALPSAALALKQGFGRLLRREDDTGVVALFDDRVHRRGYGSLILSALPPARRTDDIAEVRAQIARWRSQTRIISS
jgi:ATP-dependent DNA helicase DinG